MTDDLSRPAWGSRMRLVGLTALGAATGASVGWTVGRFMKATGAHALSWAETGALATAVAMLGLGLLIAAFASTRRGQALLANPRAPEFHRPLGPGRQTFFWLQAGVMILAGGLLASPVLFTMVFRGRANGLATVAMAGILVAFAVQTALNIAIWRRSDEVFRRVTAESGAVCFWLLQGLLFLWASGEKLRILPTLSSWDAVTILMAVYLVTSAIVSVRRGLG